MGTTWDGRTIIPSTLSPFLGRQEELRQLSSLLSSHRLVTITGVGGVGKTRLALEVARNVGDAFPQGVWVVDLSLLEAPDLVASAIARAVGADQVRGLDYIDRAAHILSAGRQLILLDNCEHLLGAVIPAAHHLLTHCPDLHLLATSRAPLRLEGEQVWPAPPLRLPPADTPEVAAMAEVESIRLFCDRAKRASPSFELSAKNLAEVGNICRRLDGLPLAIELAAAWVPILSLKQVADHLDNALDFLTRGDHQRSLRQRTMRAAVEWSYQLLSQQLQVAFERLSVFVGGFSLEGAEAMLADINPESLVLEDIASLVERSLIVAETGADEARYRFLEPIRQFAASHLEAKPSEEQEARQRQLHYLAELAEASQEPILAGPDVPWLRRLDLELPNIRSAISWGFERRSEDASRLAAALHRYCSTRNLYDEGITWAARAMNAEGWLRARAAHMSGVLRGRTGDQAAAGRLLAEAARSLREGKWWPDLVMVLRDQAEHAYSSGDLATMRARADEALALARQLADEARIMSVLWLHATLASLDEEYPASAALHDQCLAIAERHGAVVETIANRLALAEIALRTGETSRAVDQLRRCLELLADAGASPVNVAFLFDYLGMATIQSGESAPGLGMMAAARGLLDRYRFRETPDEASLRRQWIETARRDLGSAQADACWQHGLKLGLDAALADAQALLTQAPFVPLAAMSSTPLSAPVDGPRETVVVNSFLREGEFWSLGFSGRVVRLRDSKGLRDIARLLACSGREVAAVDLAASDRAAAAGRSAGWALAEPGFGREGDAGPLLDAEARQQYRHRLATLEGEIADAEAANDPARAARARQEREFLLAELSAAVGLGGRRRAALDPAERARKAVTGRIRDAINRIEGVHAELGRHLRRSIRTGAFCVYDPPTPSAWEL
jgi:predicted ATPase